MFFLQFLTPQIFSSSLDAVLYLNLKNRKDRKAHIEKELKNLKFPPDKFFRIDAVPNWICGYLGSSKTHIKTLKFAKSKKFQKVLVLEDDFEFLMNFENFHFQILLADLKFPNWQILFLSVGDTQKLEKTGEKNFFRVQEFSAAAGFVIRESFFDVFLENLQEGAFRLEEKIYKDLSRGKFQFLAFNEFAMDQFWNKILRNYEIFYIEGVGRQSTEFFSTTFLTHLKLSKRLTEPVGRF